MISDDDLLERLRTALDELTGGAQPSAEHLVAPRPDRRRRWIVPAAAALVLVVGAATFLTARVRDASGPAAPPAPTGPPIQPPTTVRVPWYELDVPGATAEAVFDRSGAEPLRTQAWASADRSEVVVAVGSDRAVDETDDPQAVWVAVDGLRGQAWTVPPESGAMREWLFWRPDERSSFNVFAYGLTTDTLVAMLADAEITHDANGPGLALAVSSLEPLGDAGSLRLATQAYALADGREASVAVAPDGALFVLRGYTTWAERISSAETPFGSGLRLDLPDVAWVWWPVDGGPAWAGVSGPPDLVDTLLASARRVDDLADDPTAWPVDASAPTAPTDPVHRPATVDTTVPALPDAAPG